MPISHLMVCDWVQVSFSAGGRLYNQNQPQPRIINKKMANDISSHPVVAWPQEAASYFSAVSASARRANASRRVRARCTVR